MSYADRMSQIELADAARFVKRLQAEDTQLGLTNERSLPPSHQHLPKRGVKRSGHYGANARRVRDRAHGAAAMPATPQQAEDLANGYVPQSYLSIRDGQSNVVYVTHTRESRASSQQTSTAVAPEVASLPSIHIGADDSN